MSAFVSAFVVFAGTVVLSILLVSRAITNMTPLDALMAVPVVLFGLVVSVLLLSSHWLFAW